MNSCQEQADVLLNRSRASLNRSSLKSRPSWGTDRTSETFSRPTSTRLTFQSQSQRESLLTGADGGQVQYQKYKWSKDSSFRSRCMDVPRSFSFFLRNLSNAFGWKFVIMIICVYGLQQGLGNAWFFQARDYYLKDVLELSPAQAQAYFSATYTPWSIKPLYGIVSDSVLFYGLQRAPYIAAAAGLGVLSFATLAIFELPLIVAAIAIFGGNLSVSSPDVMIDAIVAQQCKYFPRFASDLQALCWGSYSLFSIIGFGTSGIIIQMAGTRVTFAAIILTALVVLIPSMCGFVGERGMQRQLRAAAASESAEHQDVEATGRLSTQHQRNLQLSKQNLDNAAAATLNPIRESETSMASTVVMSAHVQAILSVDPDADRERESGTANMDTGEEEEDEDEGGKEVAGSDRVSSTEESSARKSAGVETETSTRAGGGRVEMSDEEREKTFLSTDMTLYNTHKSIFWLGLWVSFWAIVLAVVVLVIEMWIIRFAALTAIACIVALSVYFTTRKEHQLLASVALFIFLRQVFTPDIETSIFYWYTDADDGPNFSPIYIGFLKMLAYTMMFAGVVIYSRFLTRWPYRRIYVYMQLLSAVVSICDIVIVSRLNTKIGIPDEAMLLSDTTLAPCVLRLIMMPTYVLAAKVCPAGTEATLFAMLMALSNFGNAISKYVGTALVLAFNVSNSNFDNFIWVVVSKSILMLTPILFVRLLIPDGCPQDDDDDDEEEDDTTYGSLRQSILGRRSHKSTTSSAHRWSGLDNTSAPPEETKDTETLTHTHTE